MDIIPYAGKASAFEVHGAIPDAPSKTAVRKSTGLGLQFTFAELGRTNRGTALKWHHKFMPPAASAAA
jgi:hypothetical protein